MPEPKRKVEEQHSDLGLDGLEQFFEQNGDATTAGESAASSQIEKLIAKLSELIAFSVDQRVETAKIANQLIENQRQLVATQQILIRLMERSIDLTRHITAIEEKLPSVFELPTTVEKLRQRLAQLEDVELQ